MIRKFKFNQGYYIYSNKLKKFTKYLHGFDYKEQQRLLSQAEFLSPYVFKKIDFSKTKKILEVGAGVGAQTRILLKKYPHLKIDCLELSTEQIETSKIVLSKYIKNKQVNIIQANAKQLPFKANIYDGIFICWFLEHVENPIQVLKECKRVLKRGGIIYCTEVFNDSLNIMPKNKFIKNYFEKLNYVQIKLKGDPIVGLKLGNLLYDSKFKNIELIPQNITLDKRTKRKRNEMLEYWKKLLLSAKVKLIENNEVTNVEVKKMENEINQNIRLRNSIFEYTFYQAKARK